MKRLVLLIAFVLSAVSASAQLMPDGSVQIVAYWKLGSVAPYQYKERTETVSEKGDTTVTRSSSEVRIFEVIGQTDSTYTLKTTYKDIYYTDASLGLMSELMGEIAETVVLQTVTDELGSIKHFGNLDELEKSIKATIPKYVDAYLKRTDKESRKVLDKKELIKVLEQMLANPQALQTMCLNDVAPMLQYHGARLDTSDIYTVPYNFFLANGESISVNSQLFVDSAETDSTSVVIRTYAHAEGDQLLPSLVAMLTPTIRAIDKTVDTEEINKLVLEAIEEQGLKMVMNDYTATVIHLPTGWPISHSTIRDVIVTDKDGKKKTSSKYSDLDYIFSE